MTAPAAAPKGEREKTAYHVLKQTNARDAIPTFQLVGRDLTAPNAETAVRAYADRAAKAGNEPQRENGELAEGTYVAIPTRSWKPITVKTETKTVVTLS